MTTTRRTARPTADPDRPRAASGGGVPTSAGPVPPPAPRARGRGRGGAWRRWLLVLLLVLATGAWAVQGTELSALGDRVLSGAARVFGAQAAPARADAGGQGGSAEGRDADGGDVGAARRPEAGAADDLDPELRRRFDAAVDAAAADGVTLTLTSGYRTAEEQQVLVDQAVERYGVPEAYRWVLPPDRSAHVQGLAVDVGPTDGALWLGEHGQVLGLCRTYANEMWHFEMLPDGAAACPEQQPDSSWAW